MGIYISEDDSGYISSKLQSFLIELKDSTFFITGATGFFGKWLLQSLLSLSEKYDLNISIIGLSRSPETFILEYPDLKSKIKWIKGDISTFTFPVRKVDYIIHGATEADAQLNLQNPIRMLDTITYGTRRLLEYSRSQTDLKSVLIISSGAIYGRQPEEIKHIKENTYFGIDISATTSAYTEGKRLAELYSLIYQKQFNIPVKIARCFAFVGPYLPLTKHFAIGNFINDGINKTDIIVRGDGTPLRSYMYAADLVVSLLNILMRGNSGEAYNVGSDKAISVYDLAKMVSEFFPGIKVRLLDNVTKIDRSYNYVPDISKLINEFGLVDHIHLYEAISRTIEFNKIYKSKI